VKEQLENVTRKIQDKLEFLKRKRPQRPRCDEGIKNNKNITL